MARRAFELYGCGEVRAEETMRFALEDATEIEFVAHCSTLARVATAPSADGARRLAAVERVTHVRSLSVAR